MNENNIFKSRLAVAENTSSLLKSNTKILNKQLTNIEHRQYKLEQCSRQECIKTQGIPKNVTIKNLEDTVIRYLKKLEYQSTSARLFLVTDPQTR